jgi:pentatricopeptide repeat protein
MGLIEKSEIRNALVMLYGKCGAIREAEHVFRGISEPDLDSWNSMLSSYVWSGLGEKALLFYTYMLKERIHPNNMSLVTVLQACNSLGKSPNLDTVDGRFDDLVSLKIVRALRSDASSMGFALDGIAGNAFVAMYGKSGTIVEAEDAFHGISNAGISSWNAMISAYVKQGTGEKAFKLYQRMQSQRVIPDEVTYICVLQAISEMGSLEACEELHFGIICCLHDLHQTIATTLIHAYGRCSSMLDAHAIHDALASPHLASYTACIDGYASQGNFADCMDLFATLQLANISMDATVFTPLLAVCSRTGLVVEGLLLFECMMRAYNITADLMHYGSLVDLLGRAGDFNRITNIVSRMPQWEDQAIWSSLLGACRVHGNMELGEQAFSKAIYLEPKQVSAYVVMSNMVADCRQ